MSSYQIISKLLYTFSVLVSFLGLIITSFGLYLAYMSFNTASWPSTQAQIIESSVVPVKVKTGQNYRPVVKYQYTVNGISYIGDSIRFIDFNYGDQKEALKVVEKFPVGKTVELRFHGNHPKMTALEPGLHGSDWLVPAAGIALVIIALILRSVRKKWFLQKPL